MAPSFCAIYCRVSSDIQREKNTIASQRTILPGLAKKHGLEIHKEYVDDGISGESIEARPAFRQLLDDAASGLFQAVLVIDFDRLTRATDLTQLALIKKIFRDSGIHVITPSHVFDFHDDDHDFLSDLFGILAKHEKRKIVSRIRRGIKEKMRQGKWIMGRLPTPYVRINGVIEIDPEKERLIRSILADSKTVGRPKISQTYQLGQGEVTRILSRKRLLFYAGFLEVDGELVPGTWPTILTLGEAERIVGYTGERRTRTDFKNATYLLTGLDLFICGKCDRAIGSHTDSATRRRVSARKGPPRQYRRGYYRCNNRRCVLRPRVTSSDFINSKVLDRLNYYFNRLDLIKSFMEKAQSKASAADPVEAIDHRIREEEGRRQNLVSAISQGVVHLDEASYELKSIRQKITTLKQQKVSLTQKSDLFLSGQNLEKIRDIEILDLTLAKQRKIIQICIDKIVLHEANLFVYFRFPVEHGGGNVSRITLGKMPQ